MASLNRLTAIALAICIVVVGVQLSTAEDGQRKRSKTSTRVAVIDMGRLTVQSDAFRSGMAALAAKRAELKTTYQKRQSELRKLTADYQRLTNPESEEARAAESQLAAKRRDARGLAEANNRIIEDMELELFADLLRTVRKHLKQHCTENGIDLVLQHRSQRIGELDLDSVREATLADVMFQQDLDITNEILSRINNSD